MKRRLVLKQISALAALSLMAPLPLLAGDNTPGYNVLKTPQPEETPGMISVLEFFHYGCPHCNQFDPLVEKWLETAPKEVSFHRIPAVWSEPLLKLGQLYFTVEHSGLLDLLHPKLFVAVQQEKVKLFKEEDVQSWIKQQKEVDAEAFMAIYKSFGVQAQVRRAEQQMRAYEVAGVPMLAVGGRYTTSATETGGHEQALAMVDTLIAKIREENASS